MVKIIKVSDHWHDRDIEILVDQLKEKDVSAIVIRDEEMEVYDDELKNITIEGKEILEEKRFSGDSLFEVE